MSTAADLPMMHLLLRQGRLPAALSLGLLLVALLLLGIEPGLAMFAAGLLLLSVAVGMVQAYYAVRVHLDASLLQLLLRERLQDDAAAERVDQALHAAGLRRHDAQAPVRGWDGRWAGMRRLLMRQYAATLLQFAVLLVAVLWPQT
ncbi:TPA: hypothetical protein QDZ34_002441 [Stenotrophomonas maltophilia]|uniref:hypothetical protein n=1 Tax=Stenotrophomonas sp. TaxID=69392 RepID=UPI0028ABC07A|nr:hypothetical protein [Stenotrophomonas sp.]HDS0950016.1 hypothetical protein [Stenotrophomonas maltophilia]HDS1025218.1 hypothetical protein [Stenotrophomonas maltophilia]HDS1030107.1 hypothetical protein [Stenotrophomonas maltophilia]HDS1035082.1 hypothetical protein [Stenotrophomonas maltophilia]